MNIFIVEARYHPPIADALMDGATAALETAGATFERHSVPGVLEVPPAIALAARSGRPFAGFIALGSVVRGDGAHFDIISQQSAAGLMQLATAHALCIGNGIVAAATEAEALGLARDGDAGGDAARACLSLITLRDRLRKLT
jgi:6,7-dimethyl-8-ribityllumazine synthase